MIQLSTGDALFVILEPGHWERMRELNPLVIQLPEGCKWVGIVATNDIDFVHAELANAMPATPEQIQAILEMERTRPEVTR